MGIARNAVNADFISTPGEYRVRVAEISTEPSKSGKPMLTLTLQTEGGQSIRSFFLTDEAWARKTLYMVKECAGLTAEDPHESLVGKEIGILVEAQAPDANGKVYMRIAGYGKADEVSQELASGNDDIPF